MNSKGIVDRVIDTFLIGFIALYIILWVIILS